MVDELTAVVGIQAEPREGQPLSNLMQCAADSVLAFAPDRLALHPACGDVYCGESVEVESLNGVAAVGDEVNLEEPWPAVIPVRKCADRDSLLEQCSRLGSAYWPPAVLLPYGPKEPIDARSTHGQKASLHLSGEAEFTVLLEKRYELGQEWV